jgi:uncharacterized protein YceK
MIKSLALTAVFLLSGCASVIDQDGALAIAPYRLEEFGRVVIEANVNEQGPFMFALDTGASISSIFGRVRSDLDLEPVPGKSAIVHGAIGKGQFPLLDVDRIDVGREQWITPVVVALPGEALAFAGIDGVLGIDFMRRYAVGFSATERVVRLYPTTAVAQRAYQGWAVVPLRAVRIGGSGAALYFFDVSLDGHEIAAAFDLGSGVNLLNETAARRLGILTERRRKKDEFAGAFESTPLVARVLAKTVKTANIRWRNEVFSVADLEIFSTLDLLDEPAAILGAGLFTQRDFIIDFVRSRLLVKVSMDEIEQAAQDRSITMPENPGGT